MPSETPRQPLDTYQSLLNQKGNTHLPLLSGEIAWMPKRASSRKRDAKIFISGTLIGIITIIGGIVLMMNQ